MKTVAESQVIKCVLFQQHWMVAGFAFFCVIFSASSCLEEHSKECQVLPRGLFNYTQLSRSPREIPGIFYVKVHKVGGSTFAGVVRAAGQRLGLRAACPRGNTLLSFDSNPDRNVSTVYANHQMASASYCDLRTKRAFMLITMLRHPVHRVRSLLDFRKIGRGLDVPIGEEGLRWYSSSNSARCEQYNYIHPCPVKYQEFPCVSFSSILASDSESRNRLTQAVSQTLEGYDLVGVTEMFDETVVVLSLMTGVSLGDLLYFSSKDSISTSTLNTAFISQFEKAYVVEYMLWKTAKTRLLRQIGSLTSQGEFKRLLLEYRRLNKLGRLWCETKWANKELLHLQRGLWGDNGYGSLCLRHWYYTVHLGLQEIPYEAHPCA